MTHLHHLLISAALLGGLSSAPDLVAKEIEANSFIATEAAGSQQPKNRSQEAWMHFKEGRLQEADSAFQKLVSNDPSNGQAWFNLGLTQLKRKESGKAIRSFFTAKELGMGVQAHYHLALALVVDGEVLGAIDHLKSLLKTRENHDKAWTLLGRCLETYGRYAQAKDCYQKALAIDPEQGEALFRLENLPSDVEGRIPNLTMLEKGRVAPRDETASTLPTQTLPLSRVLSEDGKATQAHGGALPPLHHTYHLSSDLPNGVRLTPTREVEWSQLKKTNQQQRPMPVPDPPKMKISLEEL